LVNALRSHLAELGLIASQGRGRAEDVIAVVEDAEDQPIPALARSALKPLVDQLRAAEEATRALADELTIWHRSNEASQRLATIPGIGILTATAIAVTVLDASQLGCSQTAC